MSTISDVAKLAGLSVPTVSRVINNKEYVSQKTRQKVLDAIKELNYVPSTAAQQLRGKKSKIIGVIIPHVTNPFFANLVDNLQNYLNKEDYQIMIFQSGESKEKENKFFDLLVNKQIDGVIMCSRENNSEVIEEKLAYGPVVLCNEPFENSKIPTVALNQYQGAYIGTQYLINKGYKNIAYCTGTTDINSEKSLPRTKGFLTALKDAKLKLSDENIFTEVHSIKDGKELFFKIQSMEKKPDAIFTGSDEVAAGFILEANRHGIKVPKDIAILGFDNQSLAELTVPDITTVEQPINLLGQNVVNKLFTLLGEIDTYEEVEMLMSVIQRGSV